MDFNGYEPFIVSSGYVFTQGSMIRLQVRGQENKELVVETEFKFGNGLSFAPSMSESAFMLIYNYNIDENDEVGVLELAEEELDNENTRTGLALIPNPTNSFYPVVMVEDYNDTVPGVIAEYFYYSHELKMEFLVHILQIYGILRMNFYDEKGAFFCTKDINVDVLYAGSNKFDFEVSKNGKFLMIYAYFRDYSDSDTDLNNKSRRRNDQERWGKVKATIYEIVLVRTKSTNEWLDKIRNRVRHHFPIPRRRNRYLKQHALVDCKFELKKIHTISDLHERCDINCILFVSDVGMVTSFKNFLNSKKAEVWHHEYEVTDLVRMNLVRNGLKGDDLKTFRWVPLQEGYILFNSSKAFLFYNERFRNSNFSKAKESLTPNLIRPKFFQKLNFEIGTYDTAIKDAFECRDKNMVVFRLTRVGTNHTFIVWDLLNNAEVRSYSTEGNFKFILGEGAETGYVLQNNCYINLDHCIPNYFITGNLAERSKTRNYGYKFSINEEAIVFNQGLIFKTTYASLLKTKSHLDGSFVLEDGKFDEQDLNFSVDRYNVFHLYARDPDKLELILEYFTENHPEYLSAIMLKNINGYTAFDLAYGSKNMPCLRKFLNALSQVPEGQFAQHLTDKFPMLIKLGIEPFRTYLNTCTFQTYQMKNQKDLALRKGMTSIVVPHTTVVLDEKFMQKHVKRSNKENQLNKEYEELIVEKDRNKVQRMLLMPRDGKGNSEYRGLAMSLGFSRRDNTFQEEDSEEELKSFSSDSSAIGGVEGMVEKEPIYIDSDSDVDQEQILAKKTGLLTKKFLEELKDEPLTSQPNQLEEHKSMLEEHQIKINMDPHEKMKQLAEERELIKKKMLALNNRRAEIVVDSRKILQRYSVKAVEFSWIFDSNARNGFLEALSATTDLEVFGVDLVRDVLVFLWSYYRLVVTMFQMIPFLIYFILFLMWASWVNDEKTKEDEKYGTYYIANLVMVIFILLFIVFSFFFESIRLYLELKKKTISVWSIANMASLGLNLYVVIADLVGFEDSFLEVLCIAVLIMWFRLFYFGRLFFATAWMIRMLSAICENTAFFFIVFFLIVIGFANIFLIVARIEENEFAGENFWYAITYSFNNGIGDFHDLEDYPINNFTYYFNSIWILSTFLIFITLLNLLIAVVSDIFESVLEKSSSNMLQELTRIMMDNDWIFNCVNPMKNLKYIVFFSREQAEDSLTEDSKFAELKREVDGIVMRKEINSIYDVVMKDISKKIEQRGLTMDANTNVYMSALAERIDAVESLIAT